MAIALIDYGAGNLTSVRKGFAAVGAELFTPRDPAALQQATGIVVPGVGHFGATAALSAGWREAVLERVRQHTPVLGICLGMQWLFEGSEEAPELPGLGVFAGTCSRLTVERPLKVPHVGWNTLELTASGGITAGLEPGLSVYFTHAFAAPVTAQCVAACHHGSAFAAIVEHGRSVGVQFHPEKSGDAGLRILGNFVAMAHR